MEQLFHQVKSRIYQTLLAQTVVAGGCYFLLLIMFQNPFIIILGCAAVSYCCFKITTQIIHDLLLHFMSELEKDFQKEQMHDGYYADVRRLYWSSRRVSEEKISIVVTCLVFGGISSVSLYWIIGNDNRLAYMGCYLISNVIFHLGEFMHVCFYRYEDLSWKSFLITHSTAFNLAMAACQLEFWIGYFALSSGYSFANNLFQFGLLLSIIGHTFRIGAFLCAQSNFHHLVQRVQAQGHQLVTTGVYKISRHPSYLGYFTQVLGGQLLLSNLVCFIAFSIILWKFFYDRIQQFKI